uniref:PASTA domain-containing protein n=1 Tax=uncultured Cellulomonas sp. TaxID=189682 RepID=UPI0028E24349
ADARAALAAAGLTLGEVVHADAVAPPETVLSSVPAAGEPARAGDAVALILATGLVGVPDVGGRDVAEARTTLEAAGLAVVERPVPGPMAGLVQGSEPEAGARVAVGGTVVVLVGVAPVVPSPAPSASPITTPTPSTPPDP